ncbi:MAG: peptide deformylase [Parapedobacter sp.]|nr:MAG: peptide deformylase [Parapedobacter sp.]
MILPILSYGHAILRQKCQPVTVDYPELNALIDNMWHTMYRANGCGLAASQIGKPITLFVVDSKPTFENYTAEERSRYFPQGDEGITETFINARITQRFEETWEDEEGCLSIPSLHRKVERPWSIEVEYTDRHFVKQHRTFSGITARMIQHEYDHTQGILYLDYLQPLTRKMLESKLRKISKGHISVNYPMRFRK